MDNDDIDGVLFRFWCRAASFPGGWPSELQELFAQASEGGRHMTPAGYRWALRTLAERKGVNLPLGE
jgi:hypothetical protein